MRRSLFVAVVLVLGAGCGGSGDSGTPNEKAGASPGATSTATATAVARPSGNCSAAEPIRQGPAKQDIPDKVAITRSEIIKSSVACEYGKLEELALGGGDSFNYSFGESAARDDAEPAAYWEELEEDDEPVLATLVRVLRLKPGKSSAEGSEIIVWPAAAGADDPSDKDREAVEDMFKDENVDEWFTDDGYLGPRAGITTDGDWIFYVTGGD